jgi:hypothetical protein
VTSGYASVVEALRRGIDPQQGSIRLRAVVSTSGGDAAP